MDPARPVDRDPADARPAPLAAGDTLRIGPDTISTDPRVAGVELGEDARELLRAAARPGGTGCILLAVAGNFGSCAAGGQQFVPDHSRLAARRWEAAVAELVRAGLVQPPERRGCLYRVRAAGYDIVSRLG